MFSMFVRLQVSPQRKLLSSPSKAELKSKLVPGFCRLHRALTVVQVLSSGRFYSVASALGSFEYLPYTPVASYRFWKQFVLVNLTKLVKLG